MGTEVKSLREGRASLVDGFVDIDGHEAWLHGVHIPEYTQGTWTNHSARRKRKLLLNRAEIDKIERRVNEKGLTVDPAGALLQGRPGQGRDRAGEGQEVVGQAARARRAAGQPGEGAGPGPPAQGHGRERDADVDACLAAPRDCPGSSTSTPTSCRRACGQGAGAVRRRRAADRPTVADPLPRHRRGAGRELRASAYGASPRWPTPTGRAWRDVPQRLGARLRRATSPSRCGRRRSTPSPRRRRTSRSWLAAASRCSRSTSRSGAFDLDDPLLDEVWGLLEDAGTPVVVHAGSGPVGNDFTGPGPVAACWPGTRGWRW